MSDPKTTMDNVGVTFVNIVTNQGMYDGVFNINFATALFSPIGQDKIDTELVIACRLRMGKECLLQLKASVDALVDRFLSNPVPMPDAPAAGDNTPAPSKPN